MVEKIGGRLLVAGCTDVGCVRTLNEDNFRVDSGAALLVVADGMGGHDAGEVASKKVVDSVCSTLRDAVSVPLDDLVVGSDVDPDATLADTTLDASEDSTLDDVPNPVVLAVQTAISRANTELNRANRRKGYPDGMGMGSTVVGLWFPEFSEHPLVFHVGDSRLYLQQRNRMRQITKDHSMYQQWLNFGGKGEAPAQNILLQAMGPSAHVTPDVRFQKISKGDVVLLCSDGLSGMISDAKIQKELSNANKRNLGKICGRLVQLARAAGGKDNITAIVGNFT